jgi:hypothetical protein
MTAAINVKIEEKADHQTLQHRMEPSQSLPSPTSQPFYTRYGLKPRTNLAYAGLPLMHACMMELATHAGVLK